MNKENYGNKDEIGKLVLKKIIFVSIFLVLFFIASLMLIVVIKSTPKENLDSIDGTWVVPAIFGTYYFSISLVNFKSSQTLTNKIFDKLNNPESTTSQRSKRINGKTKQ